MRVLYLLANYPQSSESYIDAEINYVRSQGIEVAVWSEVIGYGLEIPGVQVFRGPDVHAAIRIFNPDLLHVHYLVTAQQLLRNLFVNLPITVRAHSFDWDLSRAAAVSGVQNVRAIYAFPHFAREAGSWSKVVALPVAYDAALYDAPLSKPVLPERVVRLAAGRRMKGLEDFFAVAKRVAPRGDFWMAATKIHGDEAYVDWLVDQGLSSGVIALANLGRAQAVNLIRTAWVYLDTSDPAGHQFGMPISVAEALASGSAVIMRDSPAAREYCGAAAAYYKTVEEAAIYVNHVLSIRPENREVISQVARERARLFRSDVVLPRLVDDWKRFVSGGSA